MIMLARQGNASFEPEIMEQLDREDTVAEDIKVCVGICPLGHDCVMGCFDPRTCSKW